MTTKLRTACELYMPLWTLDELFDAAYHLGLSADVTQKNKERFAIFGGVPRGLFTANERFVSGLTKQLVGDIFCSDPLHELRQLVNGGRTYHEMCHYQPKADDRESYTLQIASKFVSRLVLEELTDAIHPKKREALFWLLQGIPKGNALCGHLIEMNALAQLVRGGAIHTRCITKPDLPVKRFKLNKSKGFNFFKHEDLSSGVLLTTPYHIAAASNFQSVDSFYYDPCAFKKTRQKLLFQMMVSSQSPVKGKGIVALLRGVGWLDKALKDPTKVALIFVCAVDNEKVIDCKQPIHWTPAADGENINIIPGIGDEMVEALALVNVKTLVDFRTKLPKLIHSGKDWLLECVTTFEKFEEDQNLEREMFSRMPQYVWKV